MKMKINVWLEAALVTTLAVPGLSRADTFSRDNLKKLPVYERYELRGTTNDNKPMSMIIEYHVYDKGTSKARWRVEGIMDLGRNKIEESYTIALKPLEVIDFSRKQSFERGHTITKGEFHADLTAEEETEFLVGTVQAMIYMLRLHPFTENSPDITIRAPQQSKGPMNFKTKYLGLAQIHVPAKGDVYAHYLELSLQVPLVGAFIPKLHFYFLNDPQRTLVTVKGNFFGGAGKIDVKLAENDIRF